MPRTIPASSTNPDLAPPDPSPGRPVAAASIEGEQSAPAARTLVAEAPGIASNSSSWMVKTTQTATIHGVDAAKRVGLPGTEGAGAVVEAQVTILARAERACVSRDARNRAETAIRSSRRVTTRTAD